MTLRSTRLFTIVAGLLFACGDTSDSTRDQPADAAVDHDAGCEDLSCIVPIFDSDASVVTLLDASEDRPCLDLSELPATTPALTRIYPSAERINRLRVVGDQLYFSTYSAVWRMPLAGGAAELVRSVPNLQDFNVVGAQLLFTDEQVVDQIAHRRVSVDALTGTNPRVLLADANDGDGALLNDGLALYVAKSTLGIQKIPLNGDAPSEVGAAVEAQDLALLDGVLYALDYASDALVRVPTDGTPAVRLVEIFHGGNLVGEGPGLVWADGSEGTVRAYELGATMSRLLSGENRWPSDATVSGNDVYFNTGRGFCSELRHVPRNGSGPAELVLRANSAGRTLAVADGLLIAGHDGIYHLAR